MAKITPERKDFLEKFARDTQWHLEAYAISDLVEIMPRKQAEQIRIVFACDEDVYTDGYKIHIGMYRLGEGSEYQDAMYFLGHELGHIHSTPRRDWIAGQIKARTEIFRVCTRNVLGVERIPCLPEDVVPVCKELAKKGLYLSPSGVQQFCHSIQNIIEDGRIEAARRWGHPGFTSYTVQYRVAEWNRNPAPNYSDTDPITAGEELNLVIGQLYYLATMGHWQKGFFSQFSESMNPRKEEIYSRCKGLIPMVSRAVIASTCKECMEIGREIAAYLAPLYYEACKEAAVESQFMELLKKLFSEVMDKNHEFKHDEEKGPGRPIKSPFGSSVLVVELDDEEFDKMKEQSKESSTDEEPNVIFVRKHPKDEETDDSDKEEKASQKVGSSSASESADDSDGMASATNKSDDDADSQESSGTTSSSDGEPTETGTSEQASQGNSSESSNPANGTDGTPESSSRNDSGDSSSPASPSPSSPMDGTTSSSSPESESGEGSKSASDESESGKESKSASDESESGEGSKSASDESESGKESKSASDNDEVEKLNELAEAAKEKCSPKKLPYQSDVDNFDAGPMLSGEPSEPFDMSGIDETYQELGENVELIEERRTWNPCKMLPFALLKRGKKLKKEIKQRLKKEKAPTRRGLRSGYLDDERLSKLAMKQTDCFVADGRGHKVRKPAVYILIDTSGSMRGQKFQLAMESAAVVEESFKDICPVKIVAFDSYGSESVRHRIVKDWDEGGKGNLSYNFFLNQNAGNGNKDGYSIRCASADLCRRPEAQKLLVVLSDGVPTDYRAGISGGISDTISAIKAARHAGIATVGIFFEESLREDNVSQFKAMYDPAAICVTPDQIEENLVRVLTKFFFK